MTVSFNNNRMPSLDELKILFFVIILILASTMLCKAQTIDRKLMKNNSEQLFEDKAYDSLS